MKKHTRQNPGSIERPNSPLRSAAGTAGSGIQIDQIDHPEIAERLATLERIASIGVDELPDLVRELMAARSHKYDNGDLLPTIDRWIELDPAGGFEFFASQFPDKDDQFYLPLSASPAIDYLAQLPDGLLTGEPEGDETVVHASWHRPSDVDVGLAKLDEIADPKLREIAHAWLLEEQAHTDPQIAIASAQGEISSPAARKRILENALRSWAATDLHAASAWLSEQPRGGELDGGITGILGAMRITEPDAAIQWAAAISEPESRIEQFSIILNEQALAWAQQTLEQLELGADEREQLAKVIQPREARESASAQ